MPCTAQYKQIYNILYWYKVSRKTFPFKCAHICVPDFVKASELKGWNAVYLKEVTSKILLLQDLMQTFTHEWKNVPQYKNLLVTFITSLWSNNPAIPK